MDVSWYSAHEEDLTDRLDAAIEAYPDTVAVLVRRHGIYGRFLALEKTDDSLGEYLGAV